MSTALILGPSVALSFGTKKNPQSLPADAHGVALAAGKVGTEARKALKNNMPEQAANGTFAPFAGFIAASLPKVFKAFMGQLDTKRRGLETLKAADGEAWADKHEAVLVECQNFSLRSRIGFNMLVQFVLNNKPEKLTKAQIEALALVDEYVAILAARAEAKAKADAGKGNVAPL